MDKASDFGSEDCRFESGRGRKVLLENIWNCFKTLQNASAGNRTRASRVAGENSTTEPPMLGECVKNLRAISGI